MYPNGALTLTEPSGGTSPQVCRSWLSDASSVLWSGQCNRKRHDHAQVSSSNKLQKMDSELTVFDSSVVLWISQNMEDDYTYNLAL